MSQDQYQTTNHGADQQALIQYLLQQISPEWSVSEQAYQPFDIANETSGLNIMQDRFSLMENPLMAILNGTFDYSLLDDVLDEDDVASQPPDSTYTNLYGSNKKYAPMIEMLQQGNSANDAALEMFIGEKVAKDPGFDVNSYSQAEAEADPMFKSYVDVANQLQPEIAANFSYQPTGGGMRKSDMAQFLESMGITSDQTEDSYFSGSIDQDRADEQRMLTDNAKIIKDFQNGWGGSGKVPRSAVDKPSAPTNTAPTTNTAPALRGLDEDAAKKAAWQADITGIDLNLPSWVSMPDWLDGSGMSIDTDPNNPLTGPRYEQQAQQIEDASAARRERQEAGTAGRNEGNWQQDISNLWDDINKQRDNLETGNSGGNWWQDIKDLKFWGNDKEEGTGPGGTPVRASSADIENRRRNRTSSGDVPWVPGMDPRDAPNGKIDDGEMQSPPSRLPGPEDRTYRDESGNIRIGVDTSGHGASTPNQVAAIPQKVRRSIENTYFDEYGEWLSYEDMSKSLRVEMDRLAVAAGTMPGESLDEVIARLSKDQTSQTSQRGKGSFEDQYGGSQRPGAGASPTPWTLQPGLPSGPSGLSGPSGPSGPYGPSSQPQLSGPSGQYPSQAVPWRHRASDGIVNNKEKEQALVRQILDQKSLDKKQKSDQARIASRKAFESNRASNEEITKYVNAVAGMRYGNSTAIERAGIELERNSGRTAQQDAVVRMLLNQPRG